jgi:HEAT repeat protein
MLTTLTTLRRTLLTISYLTGLAASAASANDYTTLAPEKEQSYLAQLKSDASPADKAMACKYLSIYGSDAAVAELAKLLGDEQLASWSRIALEAIPGPTADEALRNAVPQLQGKLLAGAINSIGVRRDAAAVDALTAQLKNNDAEVASSAAVALGRIGNPAATQSLRQALATASPVVRNAVAEGCVLCAERRLAEGQAAAAIDLYDTLRKTDLPQQRIVEATRGSILARKTDGIPLLVEQLKSSDKTMFNLGLTTARELPGGEVGKALMAEVVGAAPERAALLLYVLADRRDTAVLPQVLEAASSGHEQVRVAAISILPKLGDKSCVAPLLKIAMEKNADLAEAAKTALAGLPGATIDADITSRLASADGASLPVLIDIVGRRRIPASAELLKATDNSQASVRGAAWMALGNTVGPNDLKVLITEVVTPKHPEDAEVAQKALRAACVRMPERDACADQLTTAMGSVPVPTQCTLLQIMGSMGGQKALDAMSAAAKGNEEALQDAATRSLGEWMNVEAGPVLLDLAKSLTNEKYQVRAMRGYLRLARQFAANDKQRVEMCGQAMGVATRPAEQKLILEILGRTNSLAALKLTVKASQNPELKDDATKAAKAIYDRLPTKTPEANDLIGKVTAK